MKEIKRDQELLDLIHLDPFKLTSSMMKDLTTTKLVDGKLVKPKYELDDYFLLKKGECCDSQRDVITSIGILLMNKWFIEPYLSSYIKYQNARFGKGIFKKLDNVVAKNYRMDNLPYEAYEYHLNASLSQGQMAELVSPSYSEGTLSLPPESKKLRDDLFAKNAKALEDGDLIKANEIRDQVIESVKKELKKNGDIGLENYDSGSKAGFTDTYALMNIMQGPVKRPDGTFKIIKNSYDEGITKTDYIDMGNAAISGAKSRALDVAVGGTIQRKIISMAQEQMFAGPNTDCGTKKTIKINLKEKFHEIYIDRYIDLGDGKPYLLTEENIKKFIGREIHLFSGLTCTQKAPYYCEKCLGIHPNTFGIKKVGLLGQGAGSALLNSNLKAFHVQSYNSAKILVSEILLDDDDDD